MKKLSAYLFLILFSFSAPSFADDISEYQIEGISIGDSLLDHMSEEEIITQIENNRSLFYYTTDEFAQVFKYDGLQTYFMMSFYVKTADKNFIIHGITGTLPHAEDINSCYKKMSEISKEFSVTYKNAKKNEETFNHPVDSTGRSKVKEVYFRFRSGDEIRVICMDFEESLRIKNNWIDGLDITIQRKEVSDWMIKRIN